MLRKKQKIECNLGYILALVFLMIILCFTVYEGKYVFHDCTGENCPICHELQILTAFTKQILTVTDASVGCVFGGCFIKMAELVLLCEKTERNLVIDKVRLDN